MKKTQNLEPKIEAYKYQTLEGEEGLTIEMETMPDNVAYFEVIYKTMDELNEILINGNFSNL